MDKNDFLKILKQYSNCSIDEAQAVFDLKKLYPYSQLLHTLSSRISKDQRLDSQQQELQLAAIYTADRSVLKEIMMSEGVITQQPEEIKTPESPKTLHEEIEHTIDNIDLADTVLADLNKLNTLKHNFEMLFADHTKVSLPVTPVKKEQKTEKAEPVSKEKPLDKAEAIALRKAKAKAKKERIIALAKLANASSIKPAEEFGKKIDNPADQLIEEIETTKGELQPESERQKEQLEIIDQFIKTQPSISSARDKVILPPGDLNAVKTGEFGENIVSETLVDILIKQGKKDRAIEVLKKLIWKYPQKKTYFASQIEELKK